MPEVTVTGERLDQWKGIADYLGRDVSTVIRWAKENGLPVYRVPGKQQRRPVFAYRQEIDAWLRSKRPIDSYAPETAHLENQPIPSQAPLPIPTGNVSQVAGAAAEASVSSATGVRRAFAVVLILALLGITGALAISRAVFVHGYEPGAETLVVRRPFPIEGNLVAGAGSLFFSSRQGGRIVVFSAPESGGTPHEIPTPFTLSTPAAISSDGKRLLVLASSGQEQEQQLWWVPLTGAGSLRVGNILCHEAALSPDGNVIAYSYGTSVFLTKGNGSKPRLLHSFTNPPRALRWSIDGERLFVLVVEPSEEAVLWKLNLDRSKREIVTSMEPVTRVEQGLLQLSPVLDDEDTLLIGGSPSIPRIELIRSSRSWLFGKRQIREFGKINSEVSAFALDRGAHKIYYGRSLMQRDELDLAEPRTSSTRPFLPGVSAHDVDFSRDGRLIAYVSDPGTPRNTLWIANSDGSNPRQVNTDGLEDVGLPRWSPDGKQIAFMGRNAAEPFRIFLVSLPDGKPHPVSNTVDNQGAPTWSKDGRAIIYGRVLCEEDNNCGIFQINLASQGVTMIPGSEGLSTARWSPNGRYIAALRTTTRQVFLLDLQSGTWKKLADGINGNDLAWSSDSHALYASRPDGPRPGILRISLSGDVQEAVDLSAWAHLSGRIDTWFAVAPDDSIVFERVVQGMEIVALHYD